VDDSECKHIKGELIVQSSEGGGVKFGDDGKTAFAEDRSLYSSMFYAIPRATVSSLFRCASSFPSPPAHRSCLAGLACVRALRDVLCACDNNHRSRVR